MNNNPKTIKFTLKRIIENINEIPAKGFSEETPKLTPEQRIQLQEMASMFESFGKVLGKEEEIAASAKSITEFCKLAESYAINECGDWFQQEIVKKDMKSMKQKVMEYQKAAQECYAKMQQLGVLYEDIKHVANRYYDLNSMQETMPTVTRKLAQIPSAMHDTTNEISPPSRIHDPVINPSLTPPN